VGSRAILLEITLREFITVNVCLQFESDYHSEFVVAKSKEPKMGLHLLERKHKTPTS
jgi:hypothetical protein